jgi:hypothetical protein
MFESLQNLTFSGYLATKAGSAVFQELVKKPDPAVVFQMILLIRAGPEISNKTSPLKSFSLNTFNPNPDGITIPSNVVALACGATELRDAYDPGTI